jgi:hypothetical protein
LDRVSPASNRGLYAYQPGREVTVSMTAEGLFIQKVLGRNRDEPRMRESVAYVLDHPPDWEREPNTYYWYYATLALFHHQGEPWERWNEALIEQLIENQHRTGQSSGSWDPVGEWARVGGRVYQTALCTLMLEVYYRYLPMFLQDKPNDAIGTIRGTVTDASTGRAIPAATVQLDLPDREPVKVATNKSGAYVLFPPEVPTFFALSASRDRYLPTSRNVAAAMVEGTTLTLDFELAPSTDRAVAVEAVPGVHHLGDNDFSGRINSQFQKRAEGATFEATFTLTGDQLSGSGEFVVLAMLVKGIQMDHRIRVNGRLLPERLGWSPRDGSFGEFETAFESGWLVPGSNTIEILASSLGSDVDDFEFVNVQVRLDDERESVVHP